MDRSLSFLLARRTADDPASVLGDDLPRLGSAAFNYFVGHVRNIFASGRDGVNRGLGIISQTFVLGKNGLKFFDRSPDNYLLPIPADRKRLRTGRKKWQIISDEEGFN